MSDWAKADPAWIAAFAFIMAGVLWYVLFKSRLGIIIRACGEDPESAFNMGIDVNKVRLVSTAIGSALAASVGAYLSIAYLSVVTKEISAGRGFYSVGQRGFCKLEPGLGVDRSPCLWLL